MEKKRSERSTLQFSVKLSDDTKKRILEALRNIEILPKEEVKPGPTYKPEWKWIDVL